MNDGRHWIKRVANRPTPRVPIAMNDEMACDRDKRTAALIVKELGETGDVVYAERRLGKLIDRMRRRAA